MNDAIRRHGPSEPSLWVARWIGGIRQGGRILDVACGRGRHARLALSLGYAVTGIDRDVSAVRDIAHSDRAEIIEADLEAGGPFALAGRTFDGVIVTNYLHRPLFPALLGCLDPAGLLIYETFAVETQARGQGPSNPAFLLRPNELITLVAPHLTLIAFEQGLVMCRSERTMQRVVAVGPQHPWLDHPVRLDQAVATTSPR
jgi:SAM-dependent methyltransferase